MQNFRTAWVLVGALAGLGCSGVGRSPAPAPQCDEKCQDRVALRALREAVKFIYNITVAGKAVGEQDAMGACPQGGSAHVFGTATSNELQGTNELALSYSFASCHYLQVSGTPEENYEMTVTGSITQEGTLAVQPGVTTALIFASDEVSLAGTVYDPPLDYLAETCSLQLGQSGNNLSGLLCGRVVGLEL